MKRKETPVKPKTANNTVMNIKEIENLIKFVQNSGVAEVSLEQKDFKLTIRTTHGGSAFAAAQPHFVSAPVHAPMQHQPPASSAPARGARNAVTRSVA